MMSKDVRFAPKNDWLAIFAVHLSVVPSLTTLFICCQMYDYAFVFLKFVHTGEFE